MKVKLNKHFASNGKVDEYDVRQMKVALNHLGYYTPYKKTGISYTFFDDFTDPADIREFNEWLQSDIFPEIFPNIIFREGTPGWLIHHFERGDWTELRGKLYHIYGNWKTKLSGVVKRKGQ